MIYIASPYSHKSYEIEIQRFQLVEEFTAKLLLKGKMVFSPIVHCHNISEYYKLPKEFEFWKKYCIYFLDKSDELLVYRIPGWEESRGVKEEIQYAVFKEIPVSYVDVGNFD